MNVRQRRICWPGPDVTCLEGGCVYCNDFGFRTLGVITRWVNEVGDEDRRRAWEYGRAHDFWNAETR